MSSRALKRAQAARAADNAPEHDEEENEAEPEVRAKPSVFSMLSGDMDGEVEDDSEDAAQEDGQESAQDDQHDTQPATRPTTKRKNKKKKKKAANAQAGLTSSQPRQDSQIDEIEQALKALKPASVATSSNQNSGSRDPSLEQLNRAFSIDVQHLHVGNEMRRLFGRAAFDAEREEASERRAAQAAMAQGGGQVQLGLADIVSGKYAAGGAGLSKLIRDRNLFVKGKEEWPKLSASGLGMDIVQRHSDGTVEYRFTHDKTYQSAQRMFQQIASTMDSQQMVSTLRYTPYHVATLLQVSEISKHERDNATAGELLERALFSFGRALHPNFASDLAVGKARLDFRRPENREFWLAAWRYIGNIGLRATWRTAFEWAKLLFILDPSSDPYSIETSIDQFALRAREGKALIEMSECAYLEPGWKDYPNICFSKSLALQSTNPNGATAVSSLTRAMSRFPWLTARLCKELSFDPPPSIWGKEPPNDWHALQTELYMSNALDLWKLPAASELFKKALGNAQGDGDDAKESASMDMSLHSGLIRQVLVSEKPSLIRHMPSDVLSASQSASDPYPPAESVRSYESLDGSLSSRPQMPSGEELMQALEPDAETLMEERPRELIEEIALLQRFFELVFPGFERRPDRDGQPPDMEEDQISELSDRTGLPPVQLSHWVRRLRQLRSFLGEQEGNRIAAGGHDEAVLSNPDGLAQVTLSGYTPASDLQAARTAYTEFIVRRMQARYEFLEIDTTGGQ